MLVEWQRSINDEGYMTVCVVKFRSLDGVFCQASFSRRSNPTRRSNSKTAFVIPNIHSTIADTPMSEKTRRGESSKAVDRSRLTASSRQMLKVETAFVDTIKDIRAVEAHLWV